MISPFALAIGGPALAAVVALTGERRVLTRVSHAIGTAGCIWLLLRALADGSVAASGLAVDPLHAGLALGVSAIGLAQATRSSAGAAISSSSIAAGIASMMTVHVAATAAFILATTAGIGVAARATRSRESVRTFVLLASTDAAVLIGLALAAAAGARAPADLDGAAAVIVAAGAIARVTLVGSPRWVDAWLMDPASPRAAVLGAARAQGILLVMWLARGEGIGTASMTVVAAGVAAVAAARAVRSWSWGSALAAQGAMVVVALGIGTGAAAVAAITVATGMAVATLALVAGERTMSGPSLGGAALGASFAGIALTASEAVARAAVDRPFVVVATATLAAALWLALAGAAGFGAGRATGLAVVPAGLALGAAAVLVAIPGTVTDRLAAATVRAIDAAAILSPVQAAVVDRVGLTIAVGGLAAALAVGRGPVDRPAPEVHGAVPAAGGHVTLFAWLLEAASMAALVVLIIVGSTRGWL